MSEIDKTDKEIWEEKGKRARTITYIIEMITRADLETLNHIFRFAVSLTARRPEVHWWS